MRERRRWGHADHGAGAAWAGALGALTIASALALGAVTTPGQKPRPTAPSTPAASPSPATPPTTSPAEPVPAEPVPEPTPTSTPTPTPAPTWPEDGIVWRDSQALGRPQAGSLVDGVQLPAEGRRFWTWDPVRRQSPSPDWRRNGTDRLVRTLLDVLAAHAAAHPDAPRVGIGDLSRPEGGDFGREVSGGVGHASHQNGLDADVYYPRTDGTERTPQTVAEVDLALAQDLVDRFVGAGAKKVFVGPSTGLRGPTAVVQAIPHHDNHLHVRLRSDAHGG